jgi:hypothetical protein
MNSCVCKNNYFNFITGESYDYLICSHLEAKMLLYIVFDHFGDDLTMTEERFLYMFDNRSQKREDLLEIILNDKDV